MPAADFLCVLLLMRDDYPVLSNSVGFTQGELESLINYICTNYAFFNDLQACVIILRDGHCFIYFHVHDFIIIKL